MSELFLEIMNQHYALMRWKRKWWHSLHTMFVSPKLPPQKDKCYRIQVDVIVLCQTFVVRMVWKGFPPIQFSSLQVSKTVHNAWILRLCFQGLKGAVILDMMFYSVWQYNFIVHLGAEEIMLDLHLPVHKIFSWIFISHNASFKTVVVLSLNMVM